MSDVPRTVTPPYPDTPAILRDGVWYFKSGYHYETEGCRTTPWTIVFGDKAFEELKRG